MKCVMGLLLPSPARWSPSSTERHDLTKLTTEEIVDLGIALGWRGGGSFRS